MGRSIMKQLVKLPNGKKVEAILLTYKPTNQNKREKQHMIQKIKYKANNKRTDRGTTAKISDQKEIAKVLMEEKSIPEHLVESVVGMFEFAYQMEVMKMGRIISFKDWLTDEHFDEVIAAVEVYCAWFAEEDSNDEPEAVPDTEAQEYCKMILEESERLSEGDTTRKCPRCGENFLHSNPSRNAKSLHANVSVCRECYIDEVVREKNGHPAAPFSDWTFIQFMTTILEETA